MISRISWMYLVVEIARSLTGRGNPPMRRDWILGSDVDGAPQRQMYRRTKGDIGVGELATLVAHLNTGTCQGSNSAKSQWRWHAYCERPK